MSPWHFHRVFKRLVGLTPKAYAAAHRTRRVREELWRQRGITTAIYRAGYGSSGRFYAKAPQILGMTPKAFQAGGAGQTVRFAVGRTSLGSILVAASQRGICAIQLGDDPQKLVRDFQQRFPNAHLLGDDPQFEEWVAAVGLVERPAGGFALPLEVRGTAFQHRVWQALCEIPCGQTRSYGEIARRVGSPKAVRAVAQACGANPVAVAIPCHRVVRTDGSLCGYHWGVERKAKLLAAERAG